MKMSGDEVGDVETFKSLGNVLQNDRLRSDEIQNLVWMDEVERSVRYFV